MTENPGNDRNAAPSDYLLDGVTLRAHVPILKQRLTLAGRFKIGSLIILALSVLGIGTWVQREVVDGIVRGTAEATSLYIGSLVAPALQGYTPGSPLSNDTMAVLNRRFRGSEFSKMVPAFKIWGPNGLVLYDTDSSNIGRVFPVEERLALAWRGETSARISDLEAVENVAERPLAKALLETYTPVRLGGSAAIAAVAEFYQRVDDLNRDVAVARTWTWGMVTAAIVLIYLLLIGFIERASSTIGHQQRRLSEQVVSLQELLTQNQELTARLRRSVERRTDQSEQFLRRLSAELHDGPTQDVGLALLWLDSASVDNPVAPAGDNGASPAEHALDLVHGALHRALDELRDISSGLGVPDLEQLSLAATVDRAVVADEERTRTTVHLTKGDLPANVCDSTKLTVYRLIQEGLANAFRYAGGLGQAVDVQADGGDIILSISDAGPGFDPASVDRTKHLGLAGMRERVQVMGGTLQVESETGCGTHIVARFPYRVEEIVRDEYDTRADSR